MVGLRLDFQVHIFFTTMRPPIRPILHRIWSTVGIFNNEPGGSNNDGGSVINSPRISDSNDVHNALGNCNPHSTTSPKSSPNPSSDTLQRVSSNTTNAKLSSDADYDREDLEDDNDQISVTGSDQGSTGQAENDRRSPLLGGAFTSLIQKNHVKMKGGLDIFHNGAFTAGSYSPQVQQPHPLNHALAAQLFFQNPLIPQPNHWLYNQLYGNYQELPWFRQSLFANNNNNNNGTQNNDSKESPESPKSTETNGNKRSITVVSSNGEDEEDCSPRKAIAIDDEEDERRKNSPSVTSTKRSPSPEVSPDSPCTDSVSSLTVLEGATKLSRSRSVEKLNLELQQANSKHSDVWRPY
ncbi:AAEL006162-PA [Aedes aegypti]|uniref:AAEL006162-PA n=1 Tax=Aedes aegypti TaxID=7159 RepID=Q177E9_AEDAE|nr:AAEL006162-PA [Aedes aegypti]